MSEKHTVFVNGNEFLLPKNAPLSTVLSIEKPCGGHGKCGKCKVIARGNLSAPSAEEKALLSAEELAAGMRLACSTYALGDCEVELPDERHERIVTDGQLPLFSLDPTFERFGVAVDLGTTTLAAKLYDRAGHLLATDSRLNPNKNGAPTLFRVSNRRSAATGNP